MLPSTLRDVRAEYDTVIGLEVHAQLKTTSKLFSGAPTAFDGDNPNRNIDAYSIGLPGVLPRLNRRAVQLAVRAGLALSCRINERSTWARKHYFYPDLPKGYQISQFEEPICEHGHLTIDGEEGALRVGITRIHLEEDAGKSVHVEGARFSLVDYNRAGVPLIEIVSEPDLSHPSEAATYLKALRAILMTIDVCDGNMQEGSFRCDANVSIKKRGASELGTRCEVKNLNSFRFVEQAIEHELIRHARVLAEGGQLVQETRLFDSQKKQTRSMRSKEESHDYRYFPDPDLGPLVVSAETIEEERAQIPELPRAKLERYVDLGVPSEAAQTISYERALSAFFDQALEHHEEGAVALANLVMVDILRELKDDPGGLERTKLAPRELAELVKLRAADRISSSQQRKLLQKMWSDGVPLAELMKAEGEQVSSVDALMPIVKSILEASPKEAQQFRDGKTKIMGYFIGQAMKQTRGKGNPQLLRRLFEDQLHQPPVE